MKWNMDTAVLKNFTESFQLSFDSSVDCVLFHSDDFFNIVMLFPLLNAVFLSMRVFLTEVDEMNVILVCTLCIYPSVISAIFTLERLY